MWRQSKVRQGVVGVQPEPALTRVVPVIHLIGVSKTEGGCASGHDRLRHLRLVTFVAISVAAASRAPVAVAIAIRVRLTLRVRLLLRAHLCALSHDDAIIV